MNAATIRHNLRELANSPDQYCLSIYLPVLQGEQIGLQNPIRLKNLLTHAEKVLLDRGLHLTAVRKMVASILEATTDPGFWNDGCKGLAILANPEYCHLVRLPQTVAEIWVVGRHYFLTPLLEFETDGSFVVLAISKNHCHAFRGDRWTIAPLDIPGLPTSEKNALPAADHQRTSEAHGGVQHGMSRQTVITGQGGASDYAKSEFLAYCRQVDAAVYQFLKGSKEPLVLAAVRSLVPVYRQANHYGHLHAESIDGNPELAEHARTASPSLGHRAARLCLARAVGCGQVRRPGGSRSRAWRPARNRDGGPRGPH